MKNAFFFLVAFVFLLSLHAAPAQARYGTQDPYSSETSGLIPGEDPSEIAPIFPFVPSNDPIEHNANNDPAPASASIDVIYMGPNGTEVRPLANLAEKTGGTFTQPAPGHEGQAVIDVIQRPAVPEYPNSGHQDDSEELATPYE